MYTPYTTEDQLLDGRRHAFFIIDNEVVDRHASELGAAGLGLYTYLARRGSNAQHSAFPKRQTICADLGITDNTLTKYLRKLQDMGLLGVQSNFTPEGRQTTNLYILLAVNKVQDGAEVPPQNLPPSHNLPGGPPQNLQGGRGANFTPPVNKPRKKQTKEKQIPTPTTAQKELPDRAPTAGAPGVVADLSPSAGEIREGKTAAPENVQAPPAAATDPGAYVLLGGPACRAMPGRGTAFLPPAIPGLAAVPPADAHGCRSHCRLSGRQAVAHRGRELRAHQHRKTAARGPNRSLQHGVEGCLERRRRRRQDPDIHRAKPAAK